MPLLGHFFIAQPEGVVFQQFSPVHIALIAVALLGTALVLRSRKNNRRLELCIALVLLMQQLMLYSWYLSTDYRVLSEGLPLYHCRVSIIMLSVGLIFRRELLIKLGSYWGIMGSVGALIYVGLDPFLFPHVTQLSYFTGHFLLLWGAVYCLFVRRIGMTAGDYRKAVAFTCIFQAGTFFLNPLVGGNYGYTASSPIGIGNGLNDVVYAVLVTAVFVAILTVQYFLLSDKRRALRARCKALSRRFRS